MSAPEESSAEERPPEDKAKRPPHRRPMVAARSSPAGPWRVVGMIGVIVLVLVLVGLVVVLAFRDIRRAAQGVQTPVEGRPLLAIEEDTDISVLARGRIEELHKPGEPRGRVRITYDWPMDESGLFISQIADFDWYPEMHPQFEEGGGRVRIKGDESPQSHIAFLGAQQAEVEFAQPRPGWVQMQLCTIGQVKPSVYRHFYLAELVPKQPVALYQRMSLVKSSEKNLLKKGKTPFAWPEPQKREKGKLPRHVVRMAFEPLPDSEFGMVSIWLDGTMLLEAKSKTYLKRGYMRFGSMPGTWIYRITLQGRLDPKGVDNKLRFLKKIQEPVALPGRPAAP